MALSATCPSCGAPVLFRSAASILAVCEYCHSTLVRHDRDLENIGTMAALVEDRSPLQLGAEGRWRGVHFALVGRIQLRYGEGLWNEWHLLFDDMRSGWLSEAGGEYVVSFLRAPEGALPGFETLQVGQALNLAGRAWTVSNIEEAECVAGAGELPFKVGAGYRAPLADLRDGEHFATLDYSDAGDGRPPLLFVGQPVDFAALALTGLREEMPIPQGGVQARVFRCPGCGSPLSARSPDIVALGCAACGAVLDASEAGGKLLSQALGRREEKYVPRLPLGSRGELDGRPVEVIGFLVRQGKSEGVAYEWREYLLASENGTYRWLTEYNGHWNVADVLSRHPHGGGGQGDIRHDGRVFRHFATDKAEVIYVAGEFTWRVRRGDTAAVGDFVAPPLLLSRERSSKEVGWSLCRYAAPAEIAAAFKLPAPLPAPLGVYANQPNPWEETHRRVCVLFRQLAVLALAVQLFFAFAGGGEKLLRHEAVFAPGGEEETVLTPAFAVSGEARKLRVRHSTNLDNNWIGLNFALVDKNSGAAWPASREIAYYSGSDSDGSWSEGSRDDEVVFRDIPPGTYYLAIDPDLAPEKPVAVHDAIEIASGGGAAWSNYLLLMLFLAAFPIFTRLRHSAFETRRWSESDHPPASSEEDD